MLFDKKIKGVILISAMKNKTKLILTAVIFTFAFFTVSNSVRAADCGEHFSANSLQEAIQECSCIVDGTEKRAEEACNPDIGPATDCGWYCCGWWTDVDDSRVGLTCLPRETIEETRGEEVDGDIQPLIPPVTAEDLETLNPLAQLSEKASTFLPGGNFSIAAVINEALNLIFPLAGLILFVMIVWGGFEMLTGAANKKSLDAGKQRIQAALIGFLLLFSSYWIIQIVESVTGVTILG